MRVSQRFDEIRVYEGIAERTGVHVERSAVRRSAGCCRSVTELLRKARDAGDGYFYLPLDLWPPDRSELAIHKPWIVVSTITDAHASK